MAFTLITITSTETAADERPAQGQATFTLSEAIANAGQVTEPDPVTAVFNAAGQLQDSSTEQPLQLVATDDPGTTPPGATYECVLEIQGAPVRTGSFALPSASAGHTVDLSVLLPA